MKSFLLPERWKREAFFIYATTDQSPLLRKILFSIVPLLLGVPTTQQQGTFRKQCLDTGIWFLLARRWMRWKKDDACLSEASCIIFFSSLAVTRKPRGTFPESHKHCFLKVPCPANQLKLHENSYFSRKCLTRRNSYVTMFGRMEDIGLFFMLKKR